ncbi:surface lipoprotein assembly modifier [Yoonia vestfoldensis]|uniref:surface lipoprotein assembly modifier n=1 Tax=Yoonia vestfoldensis TaxID=245188 RepID=UPI000375F87B|nr:surface lipoprotein assembly modifier [Yoonia vestfoldensis]
MTKLKSFALAAVLLGSAASAQTTVDLSLDDARAIATRALFSGDSALALDVSRAILTQVPDDRASLLVVAAAAPQQGDPAAGRRAGARAFALSDTDLQRYEAARLTALAAANEERFTLATFWLRRALIVAPNEAERDQTRQDARFLRQRNPWSFDVSASLVPSSNVNGGAADAIATAPGNPTGTLSDDAQALAGWRGSLGLGATYRLQENATSRTLIGAQYQATRVRITDDVDVPDEALSTDNLAVNLRHDRALDTGSIGAQLSYAMIDYRDLDSLTLETEVQKFDVLRIDIDRRLPVGEAAELGLSVGRSLTSYELERIGDVTRTTIGASLTYRLPSTDQMRLSLSFSDNDGDNPNYISTDWAAQLTYAWAEPIGPVSLSLSGGISTADYPQYRLILPVAGGRQDTSFFYSANIGFPEVSYAGFTPVLTISGSNTDSNVSRFTRDTLSAGITIRSEF